MKLCDDGHNEVCYECKDCPVCEKITRISDLEDSIFDLSSELEEEKNA